MSTQNNQSIRSSCDRCRSHKLKCTVAPENSRSGSNRCTRCIRAQVTCVFGHRSQSKRSTNVKKADIKSGTNSQETTSMQASTIVPGRVSVSPDLWVGRQEVEEGLPIGSDGGPSMGDGDLWAELGTNHDLNVFDLTPSSLPTYNSQQQFSATDFCSAPMVPHSDLSAINSQEWQFDVSEHPDQTTTAPHVIVQLSALVTNIHETSKSLGESFWASLAESSQLKNYPIGRVLSLSQDFTAILECIWMSKTMDYKQSSSFVTSESDGQDGISSFELEDVLDYGELLSTVGTSPGRSDFSTSTHSSVATAVDMPTMLLVLSCYTSLTKLYSLVFEHFESHLSHLPHSYTSPTSHTSPRWGLGLQLGELPSADETCTKVYTAVQILLDAFQSVEDVVGLPRSLSAVRQQTCGKEEEAESGDVFNRASLWTDFLAKSVFKATVKGTSEEDCEEIRQLSIKVKSLKALIRERMKL
uniref:Equisetin cluster transcription factor eqxR n=1 Tax=Fusarium heterosporum TaxID=42747 RepID=EQXR_FUSHE|nr:RecName: Full=Equisetin cluster transcription factor eqxR; AltName: Full=Equisetin biosynthesis protein R [Fusarium heterosporum]AGO86667.1 Zn2Cys6 transcription factor [Fusarium heterosporum]